MENFQENGKKIGRPRSADPKNKYLSVRFSASELEEMAVRAKSSGQMLSEYVRHRLGLSQTNYRQTVAGGRKPIPLITFSRRENVVHITCESREEAQNTMEFVSRVIRGGEIDNYDGHETVIERHRSW